MKQADHRAVAAYFLGYDDPIFWRGPWHRGAFYIGNLLPDYNPFTYLRGVRQSHAMAGHNASCRRNYVLRQSERLGHKSFLSVWDFYILGTLLHYTADAFTWVHNGGEHCGMKVHRIYEKALHSHFLKETGILKESSIHPCAHGWEVYRALWRESREDVGDVARDSQQILRACRALFCGLLWARNFEKMKKRT